MLSLPLVALAGVLVLIAVRQVGNLRLQIWQIMSGVVLSLPLLDTAGAGTSSLMALTAGSTFAGLMAHSAASAPV